ncbi:hypothetical protein PCAR4_1150030 [Paraburkholderia caribensis]|nr:hypothetical protein PCAR4_1150030 [Paraburkholderia caribensis]
MEPADTGRPQSVVLPVRMDGVTVKTRDAWRGEPVDEETLHANISLCTLRDSEYFL